jgi:AAA+ superfamily predicted ATPase
LSVPLEWLTWQPLPDQSTGEVLRRLAEHAHGQFDTSSLSSARFATPPFYRDHTLVELEFAGDGDPLVLFALDGPSGTVWLDGSSGPIHEVNEAEALALTDDVVRAYVRFFLFFLRTDLGAFVLIESPDDLSPDPNPHASAPGSDEMAAGQSGSTEALEKLRDKVVALSKPQLDGRDGWHLSATVAYAGSLFGTILAAARNGEVEMVDDDPIGDLVGIRTPGYPPLAGPHSLGSAGPQANGTEASRAWDPELATRINELVSQESDSAPRRDRDVTEALVSVLLEDAIRGLDEDNAQRNTLLEHFNTETRGETPIDRLRRLVLSSVPVIIIESDIPLVEDFVAGLIDGPDHEVSGGSVRSAAVVPGDELRCAVNYDSPAKLQLVSFHAYRGLFDAERTAHELTLRDTTVLVGCERAADVAEPLRRIADLVLTFPRIDRDRFARVFERVFEAPPPRAWDEPGSDWTRYLLPTDFHIPRRLGLESGPALELLRERVQSRLDQVTPDDGPQLSELHGMGEARQICEDFVTDIRAAQEDEISWLAVDSGLLLYGASGTGKTTLARALAKDCGIKFLAASATRWQSAGSLDVHLQAMRADFSEARRYAPSILFLDEIDSIGSRDQIGGDRNVVYQTEVINGLLEQIQGIDPDAPVIVIGATNYLERVDPALRRASRLDQAVQLPLPNISSLEQIYSYYLEPYDLDDRVAGGVEPRRLAELSLGLTGADVEFFVKGASRRARRAHRKIEQDDLIAEITRRPRRPDSAPRLGKEELRRVAAHEAGHAVARLLSPTRGADITFISVVPRTDGSLGFVASLPSDQQVMTRRSLLEQVEVALAGRAAEEVIFGAGEISAGAGGSSGSSDLAVATRTARLIVCQSGLGGESALRWSEEPMPGQEKQIDALLAEAYRIVMAKLEKERELLDRVAGVLESEQELSGASLRRMLTRTAP